MGGTYSKHEGHEIYIRNCNRRSCMGRDGLEVLDVDGITVSK